MKAPIRITRSGSPTTVLKKSTDCWLGVRGGTVLGASAALARIDTNSLAPDSQDTELANKSRFDGSCDSQLSLAKSASPNTTSLDLTVSVVTVSGAMLTAMLTGPARSLPASYVTF